MRYACLPVTLLLLALSAVAMAEEAVSPAGSTEAIGYNRLIRPILADNCFSCHGPDSASRKADLRLDRREAAIESGARR